MDIYEGKRHHQQGSSKNSRSASPEPAGDLPPGGESFRPISRTPPSPPARVGPPPSPPVPTHPIAPVPPNPSGPLSLLPCAVCGRTFVSQSLSKHVKICEKMTAKRRKTFDSSRQRREGLTTTTGDNVGTDLEQYLPKNFGLPENSPFLEKSPPNTAKATPKPKCTSVKTAIKQPSADLQRCPHCSRTFGVRAFERHVEWCADKAKILPAAPAQPPPHIADAKQRLNARTQYKAPLARGRRSSQSRDKSSNSRSASVESSRGVPSPPPRESGDFRRGRSRASESMSSNDHEDVSSHMPVIRNSRNSTNHSGDANVKARQARLARDLSSSSSHEPNPPVDQSRPPSNTSEKEKQKIASQKKQGLTLKKQLQLKKLEEIASKYEERNKKIKEEKQKELAEKRNNAKKLRDKSQIPVPKKIKPKPDKPSKQEEQSGNKIEICKEIIKPSESEKVRKKEQAQIKKEKKVKEEKTIIITKESTMSLDSLDDSVPNSANDKNCQSIGINTELLCPCMPCTIHESGESKVPNNKKKKTSKIDTKMISRDSDSNSEPKIELLYKNLKVISSCNITKNNIYDISIDSKEDVSVSNYAQSNYTTSPSENYACETLLPARSKPVNSEISISTVTNVEYKVDDIKTIHDKELKKDYIERQQDDDFQSLAVEHLEDNYEHDLSEEYDDSLINRYTDDHETEKSDFMSRHGSGDTYTKFTENPADLEEFMNMTDKMLDNQNHSKTNYEIDKNMEDFHTPKTNSIEAIAVITSDTTLENNKTDFSNTLEELKNNLKELLNEAGDDILLDKSANDEDNKNVSDMEHITVYQLKLYEQKRLEKNESLKEPPGEFKLPSIKENNKPERKNSCNKKRMQNIYKSNRKYKMLGEQSRGKKDYQTFILKENQDDNSDEHSISAEAPPLKLPRIENKRVDDNYDPFAAAARQMKELMSSDTNLPKKLQNSYKDPTRTLPILRTPKDKSSLSYLRSDNTKMIKNSLNKTYQNTPTLHRMKSFGSTTNDNSNTSFGGRCSSFRVSRNDTKKSSQKLNTTFTKSSKENISTTDKNYFSRNSSLNRSFSSYSTSAYSTPKLKDKIPKIATSMYHSFQRNTTIKQPVKLDKIKKDDNIRKEFVNLDSILAHDNSSMTDSNYIDPRLINENDNLPVNVNTILNNPDIISSMESLLTSEHLPSKFDSFSTNTQNKSTDALNIKIDVETNNNINDKLNGPLIDDLSIKYDKIMSSLEQSVASKTSIRDDDSLCGEFDLEEFMSSFDEEVNKQNCENNRISSSTTRVIKQSELTDSNKTSELNSISSSPKIVHSSSNGFIPSLNKSLSLNFSSNNIVSESLLPSSVKRSTSLLDSIQKKAMPKLETGKSRHKTDQLEQDIMQSLKELDKFYESERSDGGTLNKESSYNKPVQNGTLRRESRLKADRKIKNSENALNGIHTPNGKQSNDSAYSSLNRISPSKLSLCNSKNTNEVTSLEQIPAGSDSSGCQKDEMRSASSDEFLAMERSAELDEPLPNPEVIPSFKELETHEKRVSSRASVRTPQWTGGASLSSSGSEASLSRRRPASPRRQPAPPPRLSRFCHECGSKFPVDSAKFCIECGVKRLTV